MHRNEGPNMNLEPGDIPRFQDQDLPGTPGSTVLGEWGNALTDEIINCLVEAGISPSPTAALDRVGGWTQLRDAIFKSAALTASALASEAVETAKIQDLAVTAVKIATGAVGNLQISDYDLSKAFGQLDLVSTGGGVTQEWIADTAKSAFYFDSTSPLLDKEAVHSASGLFVAEVRGTGGANEETHKTYLNSRGLYDPSINATGSKLTVHPLDDLSKWTVTGSTWTFSDTILGFDKRSPIFDAYFTLSNTSIIGGSPDNGVSTYDGPMIDITNRAGDGLSIDDNFRRIRFSRTDILPDYYVQVESYIDPTLAQYTDRNLYIVHG